MNVREEDRKKNNCPSRGLGLAAAAIGVGVGAALYYFFSKRPENPDAGGSTSQWSCEEPHTLSPLHNNEDSYITISENSTTDTSMIASDDTDSQNEEWEETSLEEESYDDWFCDCSSATSISDFDESLIDSTSDISDNSSVAINDTSVAINDTSVTINDTSVQIMDLSLNNVESDPDADWDVTESSEGVPNGGISSDVPSHLRALFNNIEAYIVPVPQSRTTSEEARRIRMRDQALSEEEQIRILRDEAYRERSWSLEECSICFDVILKDQQVTTLPCTHHFHSECITPWLQEQQTCPNCRKAAE